MTPGADTHKADKVCSPLVSDNLAFERMHRLVWLSQHSGQHLVLSRLCPASAKLPCTPVETGNKLQKRQQDCNFCAVGSAGMPGLSSIFWPFQVVWSVAAVSCSIYCSPGKDCAAACYEAACPL